MIIIAYCFSLHKRLAVYNTPCAFDLALATVS